MKRENSKNKNGFFVYYMKCKNPQISPYPQKYVCELCNYKLPIILNLSLLNLITCCFIYVERII